MSGMATLQSRPEISAAFTDQLIRFLELVRPLTDEQLAVPSRCAGWTVGDVAGHYMGSIAEIAAGDLDGQGTPEVTERQVVARRGWSADQLVAELEGAMPAITGLLAVIDDAAWAAPAGGGFDGSLGLGIEALVFDGVLHAEEIADALGLGHNPTVPGVVASVSHAAHFLAAKGWGPATLALDGMPKVEIGDADGGERRIITGDAGQFVLAATGRRDPAPLGLDPDVNIYAEG